MTWAVQRMRLRRIADLFVSMDSRADHFGTEGVDLRKVRFAPELLACVPAAIARRHRVVPVDASIRFVRIALADPSDLNAIESVDTAVERQLEIVVADEDQIEEFLPRLYPQDTREC